MRWTISSIRRLRWHQWARIVAVLTLLDQATPWVTLFPSDTAIIVVALGALFAPVPAEKDAEGKRP